MKVLVTGGAGFIGSNLVDRLIDNGHEVTVLDNLSTGDVRNVNGEARFVCGSIQFAEDFEYYLARYEFEVIFHLAARARIQPSFLNPVQTIDVNVLGTTNILDFARQRNAKLVYAGSSSAYFDPQANPYACSKWLGEKLCEMYSKSYGLSTVIARFFNVYGPRQTQAGDYAAVMGIFERQKAAGQPLTITGDGTQGRDFTHVSDIVDGLIKLSEGTWAGEVFDLGAGETVTINDLAAMFKPDRIDYLPKRKGEAERSLANLERTQKLGWSPKHRVADYVAEFLAKLPQ